MYTETTPPGVSLLIVLPEWPFIRLLQSPQSACSTPIALKSSNECIGECVWVWVYECVGVCCTRHQQQVESRHTGSKREKKRIKGEKEKEKETLFHSFLRQNFKTAYCRSKRTGKDNSMVSLYLSISLSCDAVLIAPPRFVFVFYLIGVKLSIRCGNLYDRSWTSLCCI